MYFVKITYKLGIYDSLDMTLCHWVGVSRIFDPIPQNLRCDDLKSRSI